MKIQAAETVFQRGSLGRTVSVIIPLHNYAHLIEETLSSVASQTFEDLALIVVDDASTDDSCSVVERWMGRLDAPHLTVALLANSSNAGLSITRNTGVNRAKSEYCFFLDADNVLFPRCIEKHVRALDARKDCIGAYSIIEEFGGVSGLIGSNVFNRERLKRGNYIDAMVMLRRSAIEALQGFHPIKHGWEDYELWLRLCEQGERLLHLPEVLARYRHHQKSMLRQQTNIAQNIKDLHRNIEQLHPWVQLDAPRAQPRRPPAIQENQMLRKQPEKPIPATNSSDVDPYQEYKEEIFAKLEVVSRRKLLPVDVEIDTDYTGPVHATSFDSFASSRQREDSVTHTIRMLQFGIVAINPRPGVHAARTETGDFVRYPSIAAHNDLVERLPPSMLIHIHAFYPDVVEEMLGYFVGEARDGRFLITTTTRKNFQAIRKIVYEQKFSSVEILLIDNNGRDIGPFLDYAVDYASDDDVICHIHTKKSPDVGGSYGEKWRKSLYGSLLTQTAVDAFNDDHLGLLFPDTPRSVGWGKNRPFCEKIAANFGRKLKSHPGPIPVGNMFFARTAVARAMRDATRTMDWPREPVPYDGSVLHAIERMWPMACEHAGLKWAAVHTREIKDMRAEDRPSAKDATVQDGKRRAGKVRTILRSKGTSWIRRA